MYFEPSPSKSYGLILIENVLGDGRKNLREIIKAIQEWSDFSNIKDITALTSQELFTRFLFQFSDKTQNRGCAWVVSNGTRGILMLLPIEVLKILNTGVTAETSNEISGSTIKLCRKLSFNLFNENVYDWKENADETVSYTFWKFIAYKASPTIGQDKILHVSVETTDTEKKLLAVLSRIMKVDCRILHKKLNEVGK